MGIVANIREGYRGLLDFLYPGACLGCGDYLEIHNLIFCENCERQVVETDFYICGECGAPLGNLDKCDQCKAESPLPIVAWGQYEDPLKEVIHQFKFQYIRRAAEIFADRIYKLHREKIESLSPDLIIPVPLHSLRLKSRGFNQAEDFALSLSAKLDIPMAVDIIEKIRKTRDQVRLKAVRRLENLHGVFEPIGRPLQGERVIIVDDVFTTGATMREVSSVVTKTGGKPVLGIIAAVAGL